MRPALDRIEAVGRALLDWASASPLRAGAIIALVSLAVIAPGLATLPVTDRDEARFAQASKQMLETGDLIDIRFQDRPRWKKPVGIYWLQAASAATVGGGTEAGIWAYRLPSAVALLLAALVTGWAARPMIGAAGATLAGVMLATALLPVVEGHIAKTDAALLLSAVAALGAMTRLLDGQGGLGTALVFWLAVAASILLKGPVVPTIVLLALGSLWVVGRERPAFARLRPLPGLALTSLLVAPWLIAIWHISDGAFFAEALGRDLGGKLVEGQERHWGPPGLYLALVWVTFWPWAALIPLAAPWLWRQRRAGWLVLLAGWVIPFWLVLEAVPTKLPHYVLPLYPALAIALASWLVGPGPLPPRWARRLSAVLLVVPGLVLILLVAVVPSVLALAVTDPTDGPAAGLIPSKTSWPAILLGAVGGLAILLAARAALAGRPLAQTVASIVAALALFPAALQFALPSLGTGFPSSRMAEIIERYQPCASGPAWSVGYHEPSLVFLTRTDIRLADPEGAVAALGSDPGALVLVESRWRDILGGLPDAVTRERLGYFNYNRGKMETAELLTPDHPRWKACENEAG